MWGKWIERGRKVKCRKDSHLSGRVFLPVLRSYKRAEICGLLGKVSEDMLLSFLDLLSLPFSSRMQNAIARARVSTERRALDERDCS